VDLDRFAALLRANLRAKNLELERLYGEKPLAFEPIFEEYRQYSERLRPRVRNITSLLWDLEARGARLLFEGAQGALLDVDLGTYPFVTSSNTSFLGLGAGTGFSPRRVGTVLGILKAYTTRVGEGPFPTEIEGDTGDWLRTKGGEFGATTGRPRRCGWLDIPSVRYAIRFGDVDALVITKLDVLSGLRSIRVGIGYSLGERLLDDLPPHLDPVPEPVYRDLPGWEEPIEGCRTFMDLPGPTRNYLQFIADECRCPISMVSVGPERSAMIRLDPPLAPRAGGGRSRG